MIHANHARYILGFTVGVLLASGVNALQPREVFVTIAKPITTTLEITPLSLEALK